jgi:methylphosphotriester-DNA--protein-cysteine methyltransferase
MTMTREINNDNGLQDWKTEHQAVTKAKIKRADSANFKGIATNKLYCRLTVTCSEMPASF